MDDADVMRLLKVVLKASGKQGVPQGGVISPLLSNIDLTEVDRMLERAKEATRYGKYTGVEYARFADDLVILIDALPRHDRLMAAVKKRLREELAGLQVEITKRSVGSWTSTEAKASVFWGSTSAGCAVWLPRGSTRAESRSGRIGPIIFGAKQAGERSARKPHAAFDEAGAGNVAWPIWCDTRNRKSEPTGNTNFGLNRRVSPRPYR